jgi:hypothetical protein
MGFRNIHSQRYMTSNAGKLLVVESDATLQQQVVTLLRDAGYQVSTDVLEGLKTVLAFAPDVVILGAGALPYRRHPNLNSIPLLSGVVLYWEDEQAPRLAVPESSPW